MYMYMCTNVTVYVHVHAVMPDGQAGTASCTRTSVHVKSVGLNLLPLPHTHVNTSFENSPTHLHHHRRLSRAQNAPGDVLSHSSQSPMPFRCKSGVVRTGSWFQANRRQLHIDHQTPECTDSRWDPKHSNSLSIPWPMNWPAE